MRDGQTLWAKPVKLIGFDEEKKKPAQLHFRLAAKQLDWP